MNWQALLLASMLTTETPQPKPVEAALPKLPPPRLIAAPTPAPAPVLATIPQMGIQELDPARIRTSRYEVWQWYGVNVQGKYVPRVIYSPSGAYYRYNGQPFPWSITHEREFIPYLE